ncbi:protein of unknown function [Desulfatibacillum alkenivorans DSM 16219]|jgi:hypothetical protein|uniref:DUF4276 family protein n=1 Tax=Desulfatibacillum alkenivorans DSM 16219 TaxID=1121393 RepID=A0A1M6N647_9BACT|nr:DUF4276 family protein [Desulfatibacillum alkenivorans]SHJ91102.1 protein of unknown function [Desulfatibacillum alkenivorans DSM 16219]
MSKSIVFYVEGPSEREFVNEIIGPHLSTLGIPWHKPILVANSVRKDRTSRGGVNKYGPIRKDLRRLLHRQGDNYIITTLIDYYGRPSDFPAPDAPLPIGATPLEKALAVENAWAQDINDSRFLPFLFLHEYETLILSDPNSLLTAYPGEEDAMTALVQDTAGFENPEDINDSPITAPSKRIIRIFEAHNLRYDKVTGGALAVLELGLDAIRQKCPKFNCWLTMLESLAPN